MVTSFMQGEGVVPSLLCRLSVMDSPQGGGREAADPVAADLQTWASVMEMFRVDDGFHPASHSIEDLAAEVLRHRYLEKVYFPACGRSGGGSTNMVTYPCWRHDGIRVGTQRNGPLKDLPRRTDPPRSHRFHLRRVDPDRVAERAAGMDLLREAAKSKDERCCGLTPSVFGAAGMTSREGDGANEHPRSNWTPGRLVEGKGRSGRRVSSINPAKPS